MKLTRLVVLVVTFSLLLPYAPIAYAASITSASDTLSTMKQSTLANHTIQMTTPTGVGAGKTIVITFPTGFSLLGGDPPPITYSSVDLAVGANCGATSDVTLAAVAAGATWGADISGQVVTLTSGSGTVAAGGCIQIEIGTNATFGVGGSQRILNQTAAQNNTDPKITLTAGASDTGTLAVEIVADNDVTVNATVDPSITCTFTGLTTTFASLTTGAVSMSDTITTITASSNGQGGLNIIVYDAGNATNPGLYKSAGTTYLIGSADSTYSNLATLVAGTDGFGLIISGLIGGSGAALTPDGRFDGSGGANEVGGLEVGAGAAISIGAATGALANRVLSIGYKAAVSGLAPAGSYTDNVTYVCTGTY